MELPISLGHLAEAPPCARGLDEGPPFRHKFLGCRGPQPVPTSTAFGGAFGVWATKEEVGKLCESAVWVGAQGVVVHPQKAPGPKPARAEECASKGQTKKVGGEGKRACGEGGVLVLKLE